jgi:hypothetical protein
MRTLILVALVMAAAVAAACGGKKEPLLPDGPDMTLPEGGADDPAASASAAPAAAPTAPAK